MRYLITILSIIVLLSFIEHPVNGKAVHPTEDTKRLGNRVRLDLLGKTIHFYGNSITEGVDASPQSTNRWTTLFCGVRGATEDNHGVSGMTLCTNPCGTGFVSSVIPVYNPATDGALFIDFGTNDIGYAGNGVFISTDLFRTTIRAVLSTAVDVKAWERLKVVVVSPYYALSYNAFIGGCFGNINNAATQNRADSFNNIVLEESRAKGVRVIDAMNGMRALNNTYYSTDSLHPNNAGHAFIANMVNQHLYIIPIIPIGWRRRKKKYKQAA